MLTEQELEMTAERVRRGEPLRPTAARLAAARALLAGNSAPRDRRLGPWELGGLTAVSLALTPLAALAAAWTWRDAPAGRQALFIGLLSGAFDGLHMLRTWFG